MGELLALRWRDIDFQRQAIHVRASFAKDVESTPKSGSASTVPMVDDVARELGKLGDREQFIRLSDLVFCGSVAGRLASNKVR